MMKNSTTTPASGVDLDLSDSAVAEQASLMGFTSNQLSIDTDQPGKQHGHLKVSVMDQQVTSFQVRMPVCVINGESPGPTVTLMAGIHGDESVGSVVARKLATRLSASTLHGRLIILPAVNTLGLRSASRCHPIDGINIDYAFPGHAEGSFSERLAHEIVRRFITPSELVVDLRSGGSKLQFMSSAAVRFAQTKALQQSSEETMIAFGAPYSVRLPASSPRSCLQACVAGLGRDYVQLELGGGNTYEAHLLTTAYTGCMNILKQRGMLHEEIELAATRLLEVRDDTYYVHAEHDGWFEPLTYLGESVYKDQPMANLMTLNDTSTPDITVTAPRDAILLASHTGGYITAGELVAILAEPVQA